MRLGTRWSVGETPAEGLPEVVLAAVRTVEDELRAEDVDARTWRWTLTWLEGRPVLELDDGTVITYNDVADTATIRQHDATIADDEED
ncbi:hypothetical protein [Mycetocola sp.]|uniref:hypothetical protein n=1 Tax=Mycetocola sp. TaxID=1871042 RepID=UPI0039890631